jgi:uncharacterized delta-60 repeat protein
LVSATRAQGARDFGDTNEDPIRIVLDPQERILVVGASEEQDDAGQAHRKVALARFTQDGALDRAFNAGGPLPGTIRLTPPNVTGYDHFEAWSAYADNDSIFVSGANGGPFDAKSVAFLFKLRADGNIDPSFAAQQDVSIAGFTAVTKTSNGVLVAGNRVSDGAFVVKRFSPTGVLDHAFGDGGTALSMAKGEVRSMLVEPNGDIIVAGHVRTDDSSGQLVRFSSAGVPLAMHYTSTLHSDGVYAVDGIVRQCDGKLLLGGEQTNRKFLGVDRVSAGGTLDIDYGVGGTAISLSTNAYSVGFNSLLLDPRTNAAIVVGGRNQNDGPEIYRFLP